MDDEKKICQFCGYPVSVHCPTQQEAIEQARADERENGAIIAEMRFQDGIKKGQAELIEKLTKPEVMSKLILATYDAVIFNKSSYCNACSVKLNDNDAEIRIRCVLASESSQVTKHAKQK